MEAAYLTIKFFLQNLSNKNVLSKKNRQYNSGPISQSKSGSGGGGGGVGGKVIVVMHSDLEAMVNGF